MKKITVITFLLLSSLVFCQKSLAESKDFEQLTKEELYQIGKVSALDSYTKNTTNLVVGIFVGSFAIDAVNGDTNIVQKYERWVKEIDIDDRFKENKWFSKGFIDTRKEMIVKSLRKGRLITRIVGTVGLVYLISNDDGHLEL